MSLLKDPFTKDPWSNLEPADPTAAMVVTPERLVIARVDDPFLRLTVQFNPTQFEEVVVANYQRMNVVGSSYKPLQYMGSENHALRLDLFFHANISGRSPSTGERTVDPFTKASDYTITKIHEARNFLMSLVYPTEVQGALVKTAAPPRVFLLWPNMVSMTCVFTRIRFQHEMFRTNGMSRQIRAECDIEEASDVQILSSDVRQYGTLRAAVQSQDF